MPSDDKERDTDPDIPTLRCPRCHGRGRVTGGTCPLCHGRAVVTREAFRRWRESKTKRR